MFNKIFKNISIVKNNTYIFIGLLVFVFLGGFFFVNYSKDNKIEASTATGITLSELTHRIVNSSKATISFKVELVNSNYATTGGRKLCWTIENYTEPVSSGYGVNCTDVTSSGSYPYAYVLSDTETLDIDISSFDTGDVIYYWGYTVNNYGSDFTDVGNFKIVFADLTAEITKSSPESIVSSVFISSVENIGSFGTSFNNNNLKDVAFHITGGIENEESPSSPEDYQSYSSSSSTEGYKDDNITVGSSRTFESTSINLNPGYYFARACVITYNDGNPDNDCSNWLKFKVPKDFSISISGDDRVSSTLSVSTNPSNADVDYQWQRADSRYATYRNISGATNSSYTLTSDDYNKYIKSRVSGNGIYQGANIGYKYTEAVGPVENIEDQTKRISFWPGKVNQHYDISSGSWKTDPDGVSGGWSSVDYPNDWGDNPVGYCEKIYNDDFEAVSFYQDERITTWRSRGNVGGPFTSTKATYACLEDENTDETGTWTYFSTCPTECGYNVSTITQVCIGNGPCSGEPETRSCSATSACPSGALAVQNCKIQENQNTCVASVDSWNVFNPISGAATSITTNYPTTGTTVTGTTATSGTSKTHTVYYSEENSFYLYHNEVLLDTAGQSALCDDGLVWDATSRYCKQGETTTTSGSLSVSGCTIQTGQSTCSATINSWSVTNPVSGANTAITTNYPTTGTTVTGTSTTSGTSKSHTIANGNNLFFLYHNGVKLNEATATASCVSGSTWDGDSCEQSDSTSTIGELLVYDCIIERGYGQCNVNLSWSVTSPNSTTSSKVTTRNSNGTDYTVNSSNTGNTTWPVSYGTREFKLWDDSSSLDTKTGRASCSDVDMWDGNKCIKKPNGDWSSWFPVDTTCDYTYTQRRTCVGGSDCVGESERTVTNICIEDDCEECPVCPPSSGKKIPVYLEN